MKKVKAIWGKVPAGFKKQAGHVLSVFVVTFVATAAPAVPEVLSQFNVGKVPSLSSVHAVVAAAFAASLRASIPVARVAIVKAAFAVVRYEERKGGINKAVVQVAVQAVDAAVVSPPEAQSTSVRYEDGMVSR